MDPINTKVSVGGMYGKMVAPNLTFEETAFWGRPNFRGEANIFGDDRKQFNVLIKPEDIEALQRLGYNAKLKVPTPEEIELGREPIGFMKVMVDTPVFNDNVQVSGSEITIVMGDQMERLNANTIAILDKSRVHALDMEVRAWDYPKREGDEPYSARLVKLVAVIERDRLAEKYGAML
jgi:hypothetical protein